jgi:ATP-dependent protease ClpP protease subunit
MKVPAKVIILLLCNLLIAINSYAAEYSVNPFMQCKANTLILNGNIENDEYIKFKKIVSQTEELRKSDCYLEKLTVRVNSNGGSVEESLKIGRYIRSKQFNTEILAKEQCLSSCVFIYVGGVRRSNWLNYGKIGIHRPYFYDLNENVSVDEIKKIRKKRIKELTEYFEEMDIPFSLIDEMISIPPNEMKILTEAEVKKFRLNDADANYEEKEIATIAKIYRMTSSEYRKRNSEATTKCNIMNSEFIYCYNSLMLNMPLNVYKEKFNLYKDSCTKGDVNEYARCLIDKISK